MADFVEEDEWLVGLSPPRPKLAAGSSPAELVAAASKSAAGKKLSKLATAVSSDSSDDEMAEALAAARAAEREKARTGAQAPRGNESAGAGRTRLRRAAKPPARYDSDEPEEPADVGSVSQASNSEDEDAGFTRRKRPAARGGRRGGAAAGRAPAKAKAGSPGSDAEGNGSGSAAAKPPASKRARGGRGGARGGRAARAPAGRRGGAAAASSEDDAISVSKGSDAEVDSDDSGSDGGDEAGAFAATQAFVASSLDPRAKELVDPLSTRAATHHVYADPANGVLYNAYLVSADHSTRRACGAATIGCSTGDFGLSVSDLVTCVPRPLFTSSLMLLL